MLSINANKSFSRNTSNFSLQERHVSGDAPIWAHCLSLCSCRPLDGLRLSAWEDVRSFFMHARWAPRRERARVVAAPVATKMKGTPKDMNGPVMFMPMMFFIVFEIHAT